MNEIKIQPDNFASSHFGVTIGKISPESFILDSQEIKETLLKAQEEGFKVLMTRLSSDRVDEIEKAEKIGGRVFDTLITSTMLTTQESSTQQVSKFGTPVRVSIESLDKLTDQSDINTIGDIGATAFDLTHFCQDQRLSRDGWQSFYRQWSINDVTNRAKQTIVARNLQGKIIGFNALLAYDNEPTPYGNKTLGIIDLIAVAKEWRGCGVGTRLVAKSAEWLAENTEVADVGTESVNWPALAVYQKCGFRPRKIDHTFHFWLDKISR